MWTPTGYTSNVPKPAPAYPHVPSVSIKDFDALKDAVGKGMDAMCGLESLVDDTDLEDELENEKGRKELASKLEEVAQAVATIRIKRPRKTRKK